MREERFNKWNEKKKLIDSLKKKKSFYVKDIWWAQIGQNIGSESVGKGNSFLRPVLIVRRVYGSAAIVIPLTSKEKTGDYYYNFVDTNGKRQCALLTQIRYLDAKRLEYRNSRISTVELKNIKASFSSMINKNPAIEDGGLIEEKTCTPIITNRPLKVKPILTEKLNIEDAINPANWITKQLEEKSISLTDNSILAISSKALSYLQGRVIPISQVKVSEEAQRLSVKYNRDSKLLQLILNESDAVAYHNNIVSLTMKGGMYIANAGIDTSNVPEGYVALWPENTEKEVHEIRDQLVSNYNLKNFGIIVTDSICIPARKGTIAVAIAHAGFQCIADLKGQKDLYQKEFQYASHNIADSLATAANLMMGEGVQNSPLALIQNAPVVWTEEKNAHIKIDPKEDIFRIHHI
jgi:coenzyme F420-0:L-glutamate ligase